jgi:hypothetical protein
MRCDKKGARLALIVTVILPVLAQSNQNLITLERGICFGACPAYLLQIDSSGAVSFRQGPPANRHEERISNIAPDQFQDLIAGFTAVHFFDLNDLYKPTHTDGPTTYLGLALDGKVKKVTHSDIAPPGLEELEREIERVTNVHRWLHGDPRRFTLQSPVAGPQMGGGEDLKNEMFVRHDAYDGIKPGMTALMRAAGLGNVAEIRRALQQGKSVNGADETGWTALMIAAVAVQPESVSALLDSGASVDQRDSHGDTALIGAAAVRFGNLRKAAETVGVLLAHGASVDAINNLGESALMWAARSGNPESIKLLLMAGANSAQVDQAGHNARFYLRNARDSLTFDKAVQERYDLAGSILEQK